MGKYKKKTVLLGVTGGIAAYKSCYLVSYLVKRNIDVIVIMTENATKFVTPMTFETLSGNKVYVDTFNRDFNYEVEHISLAHKGDVFVVAPATANFIAKVNNGVADDMLTTTFLAYKGKKVIVPAMNTGMYIDEITTSNMQSLKDKGMYFINAVEGHLACGDTGLGKMQEPEIIGEYVLNLIRTKRDLEGKRVLITCGGTTEDIDGVRCITNYSSGKMGVALAENAMERGADVTLISGRVSVDIPKANKNIQVKSTLDMYDACLNEVEKNDIIIKAAAPCDFRIKDRFSNKIKDKNLTLEFIPNPDIAKAIGKIKGNKKLVVFAAETTNLLENASKKLQSKNADMIVANDLKQDGAGFNTDTNVVTIMTKYGEVFSTEVMTKDEIANIILDKVVQLD